MLTTFSFKAQAPEILIVRNLLPLRIDYAMANRSSHGTLPHFGLQSSQLNIHYFHQDPQWKLFHQSSRKGFATNHHVLLLIRASNKRHRSRIGLPLERHAFSGLGHSAGELLHTP